MENSLLILLQLFLAHVVTDFVFQPTSWVIDKRAKKGRSIYLYIHSMLAGLLSWLFLMKLEWWYVAIIISVVHFFIDLWKLNYKRDTLKIFLLDQIFHVGSIILVWLVLISGFHYIIPFLKDLFTSQTFLAILIGYLLVIFPAGFLIGKATLRWQGEVEQDLKKTSLDSAGRYIGIFERILVLTFIITQNFSAIGFLIAAKSILRFSDKSEIGARKQTEYVLIGTLMSFAITIIIGFLVREIAF
ncbi:DUF3307 domain-containing protein [Gramella sp. AN32]|uniref:DUF3307 domain-containing protein n=1 Tax=Christiangramia antarctica TaxID=2058158 RepID=A0ABW5XA67_9FLAO|nr:DUF3307 domain-containing protein [Gramella sp. AN32]MCM4157380.1 DUF3307 domain-containing protein [Gramella sp. AN32]